MILTAEKMTADLMDAVVNTDLERSFIPAGDKHHSIDSHYMHKDELTTRLKTVGWNHNLSITINPEGVAKFMEAASIPHLASMDALKEQKTILRTFRNDTNPEALKILNYWFPDTLPQAMDLWFGKNPETDAYIEDKFGGAVEKAIKGELDSWQCNPSECLALVILLDQFPRNIYRHKPHMYAGDSAAQGMVAKAIYYNHLKYLSTIECVFMPCLVLTHSENLQLQELCLKIWHNFVEHRLPKGDPLYIFGGIFEKHLQVIKKFGRFPHRNVILRRETTQEEAIFLEDFTFRFDMPLIYKQDGTICFQINEEFSRKERKYSVITDTSTVKRKYSVITDTAAVQRKYSVITDTWTTRDSSHPTEDNKKKLEKLVKLEIDQEDFKEDICPSDSCTTLAAGIIIIGLLFMVGVFIIYISMYFNGEEAADMVEPFNSTTEGHQMSQLKSIMQ